MSRKFQYHMITDRGHSLQSLAELSKDAEKAGVQYFQLRAKDLNPRELLILAKETRPQLQSTRFVINGSLDVALVAKADGVHLQKGNIPVHAVRKNYPDLLIGYSAHSAEEMKEAEAGGADYVFISPVFRSGSKGYAGIPLGVTTVADWTKQVGIPVYALGGISRENLSLVASAGCSGAAGISLFLKSGRFSDEAMVV